MSPNESTGGKIPDSADHTQKQRTTAHLTPPAHSNLNRKEQEPSPTPEGAETGGETPKPRRGQERARAQKLHAGMIIPQLNLLASLAPNPPENHKTLPPTTHTKTKP